MPKLMTGQNLPPIVLEALQSIGLPKHVKSFTIRCFIDELIEIECTFYPEDTLGKLIVENDKFIEQTKRFNIVEIT